MSDEMKPVIIDEKTQRLQEIIEQTERDFNHEVKITPGEAKRIDLIRKMKQDTDKQEYMIMFNALMIGLTLVSLVHFILFNTIFSLICLLAGILYFIYIRKRLTAATLQLADYKNNFDKYLWEGFYLKEMRYSAVKLAYFIFFPFVIVFLTDFLRYNDERVSLWMGVLVALAISSIGWMIFFSDDKQVLESIESDLKALEYI
ncbi:MAG: hypothetical protein IPL08_04310 [Saprospiraceae bacterium]|nr:hypothetical protein [Saprospiraceae bacterium]MBK8669214.1 hypothetical protein [Saprospiraceae bacterium]